MKKALVQGFIIISLFFATWFVLTKANWVAIFELKKASAQTQEKLGEVIWQFYEKSGTENKNPMALHSINNIVSKICIANNIDPCKIKIHILDNTEVNAFALPDGHLIIYKGLIVNCTTPEELSGIICHEIAHIELSHVMKKLVKEAGISILVSITAGNSTPDMIIETAKLLSSSAFDRDLEIQADLKAAHYLKKSNIDPQPFSNFLFRLYKKENETLKYLTWISTHPESKERAEYLNEYITNKKCTYKSVLSKESWRILKDNL